MHKNASLYTFGKETKHKEKEVAPTTDLFNRADFFFLEYAALIGIARLQVLRLCFFVSGFSRTCYLPVAPGSQILKITRKIAFKFKSVSPIFIRVH
jgi:hypothetical protein